MTAKKYLETITAYEHDAIEHSLGVISEMLNDLSICILICVIHPLSVVIKSSSACIHDKCADIAFVPPFEEVKLSTIVFEPIFYILEFDQSNLPKILY